MTGLQARGLAVGHGSRRVGEGFDLDLRPGEVLALLGPNGSGKTTLLKTLLCLLPAQQGTLALDGRPLTAWPVGERARRMAYVPQQHTGAFAFTVLDLVLMGRTAHAGWSGRPSVRDRVAAEAALGRLGLSHLAERPATQISGGERQLTLIARALAQDTPLVLLDEPTASLDFGHQGLVMREIRHLADAGLGVLFSTHDPNHARRFADRALLIRGGRTLAQGPVTEVLTAEGLSTLYGSPVHELVDRGSAARAFFPG